MCYRGREIIYGFRKRVIDIGRERLKYLYKDCEYYRRDDLVFSLSPACSLIIIFVIYGSLQVKCIIEKSIYVSVFVQEQLVC